jgi:hypothetical protein
VLLTLALLSALHAAPAADSLPGTWKLAGDVMGNPLEVVCTIQQSAATLRGTCTDGEGTVHPITGEAKDGKVTFKYASDYQGTALTIVYSGTLASPTQIKGTVEVQPMGITGTFSAAPAPAKP